MPTRISYNFICLCAAFIVGIIPAKSFAQKGVWEETKQPDKKKKSKVTKDISRVKKLGNHIKEWGLANEYDHELLVGGRLNSNGWSGGAYYFTRKKTGTYNFWLLHFSEIKHEKQIKQQPVKNAYPELGNTTPFVFGKINNLYTLQLGFGQEQLLLPGVVESNMSVSFRYNIGISLVMLKPYYLKLIKVDNTQQTPVAQLQDEKYTDSTAALFLSPQFIHGADKWSKGLGETKLIPGLYAEAAFVIVPNPKGYIEAITLGANAAFYTKQLAIMAERPAHPYQLSLFAGLAIGKRWK
jgi:hypothetical protein